MAAKRRKFDEPAVEEVDLDNVTSDSGCDSDEEVYEGSVSTEGLPHGRGTIAGFLKAVVTLW